MDDLDHRVKQLEIALDAITDAVVCLNRQHQVQWCNQAFLSFIEQNFDDCIGLTLSKLLPLYQNGQQIQAESYLVEGSEYEFRNLILQLTAKRINLSDDIDCVVLILRDVTLTKQTEANLRESEERLRTLIDATPDVICFKDGEGRWQDSNQANVKFVELEGVDYRGKTDYELSEFTDFYRESLRNCQQTDEQAWKAGTTHRVEEVMPRPDGTTRILDMIKVPLFDDEGKRKALVVLGRDITDAKHREAARIQAEEVIRAREAQYRDLVQTANCIILRWDTKGDVLFLNEYGQRLFGFTESEIIGQNVIGTIVPSTETSGRDLEALMIDICQFPEKYILNENENICRDGRRVWIVWANKPIIDSQGNLIEILSVGTDATERKRVQIDLEKSLSLQQATFESIQEGILAVNESGTIVSYNQRFLKMWSISQYVLNEPEQQTRIHYLAQQLKEPEQFYQRVKELYATPEAESYDLLELKDGRVFERYSCPQRIGTEIIGRVWTFRDITAQQEAEAALKASEARLTMILSSAVVSINRYRIYPNRTWKIEYYSPGCHWIWGYSAEELMANPSLLQSRIIPEDWETLMENLFEPIFAEQTYKHEYRYRHPDGKLRWISVAFSSQKDEYSNTWIVTAIATDITERKKTEDALRLSEAKFRALYESLSIAIIIGNEIGIFECNRAAEKLYGCSRQEIIGKHPSAFSPPLQPNGEDSFHLANQQIMTAFEQGYHSFEWVHRRADGTDFPARITLTAVKVGESKLVQGLVEDLTERKQVESELGQRAKLAACRAEIGRALAQSDDLSAILERCAKAMVKHLDVACVRLWTFNPETNLLQLQGTAGLASVVDLIYQYIPIKNITETASHLADDPEALLKTLASIYQDWATEQAMTAFTGYSLFLEEQLVGILGLFAHEPLNQSTLNALNFIADDMALGIQRKKTEAALRVAKEMAEAANRAKSTFLANMSHELRTPLNTILGFAQLLNRDTAITPRQREALRIINSSGEHLLSLINDVLEMSKIEAGRIVLNACSFDLHQILHTLREMFWVRAKAKGLALFFDLSSNLPQYVTTDEGKFRQVLINLLGNAIKFTQTGGITLKATQLEKITDDRILLGFTVEDTGIGIADDEIQRLFEPFVQTSSGTQVKEGTGLGLAISRQYVELMGGEIQASSIVGQGSVFSFTIEVKLADSSVVIAQSNEQQVNHIAPNQPTYRILIVDDRSENRDLLVQLFSHVGFETAIATNGEEAISSWQSWQPHLIWMDIRMPIMDGYEAIRQIRHLEKQSQTTKTYIIALTANAFEEQQLEILKAGADDFVSKPFQEALLFKKMSQYLKVNYLYVEEITSELKKSTNCIQASDLTIMSSQWIEQLHQAAMRVNSKLIGQLIQEIPQEQSYVANALTELVNQFRFDVIMELTKNPQLNL
jgi:two-component system sensor histidine kinase/response regulator